MGEPCLHFGMKKTREIFRQEEIMILSGKEIARRVAVGEIVIEPFTPAG